MPEDFITYLPSLSGTMQPIQYQSCFISDRSQDEEFARRLHEKMRGEKLRVWFAPEDMQGGQKLIEQIDRAIQVNDRLLLVLSEHSLNSEWVQTELRKARQAELREQRPGQKLFPIRLVSLDRIRDWSCFDADTGKDLAVELREYSATLRHGLAGKRDRRLWTTMPAGSPTGRARRAIRRTHLPASTGGTRTDRQPMGPARRIEGRAR